MLNVRNEIISSQTYIYSRDIPKKHDPDAAGTYGPTIFHHFQDMHLSVFLSFLKHITFFSLLLFFGYKSIGWIQIHNSCIIVSELRLRPSQRHKTFLACTYHMYVYIMPRYLYISYGLCVAVGEFRFASSFSTIIYVAFGILILFPFRLSIWLQIKWTTIVIDYGPRRKKAKRKKREYTPVDHQPLAVDGYKKTLC